MSGHDDGETIPPGARRRWHRTIAATFAAIAVLVGYRTLTDGVEHSHRLTHAAELGAGILALCLTALLTSRIRHAFDPLLPALHLDAEAHRFVADAAVSARTLRIIAIKPRLRDHEGYRETRAAHLLTDAEPVLFIEIAPLDSAEPVPALTVTGHLRHGYRVLRVASPDVAGAVAAVLLHIRHQTGQLPHVYFTWTEDHPLAQLIRFLVVGVGEVTVRTREILWRAEPDLARRPTVHVS